MANSVTILNTVNDAVKKLMYYDRKEDEDLPVGAIQDAVDAGVITKEDIVNRFREQLDTWFQ